MTLSTQIFRGHGGRFQHENLQFLLVNMITQQILVTLGPNLYHGCVSGVSWLSFEDGWPWPIFRGHGNSTHISNIGPKRFQHENLAFSLVNTIAQQILVALCPNVYPGCVAGVSWLSFEDGWPWPIFRGHGGRFQHENLQFSLVDMITQQILVALGPNLCHGCIIGVSWLCLKLDDLDPTQISRSWGSISTCKFAIFACKHDNSTNISRIVPKLIPWMCLRSVLVKFRKWMTLTYFSRSWGSISTWKFASFTCRHDSSTNISRIRAKLIPWIYHRSVLGRFEDGWPWPIFRGHGGRFQ